MSHGEYADETDERMSYRYITLSTMDVASIIRYMMFAVNDML